ncbi:hypothetical protein [Streptacidiphilus jiangxiensis]|uniref:Uncharacterized protein n=1 Tax=Streptacidiphilus jiangxiensis TaxID=235985 RepID=A0A1H7UW95_STRJI|nr:hypothetical protein [Streptacidiphilus jiangxiensis]SEM01240.1 hypothetical protein SAMN05414137_116214 [Streptacidiphilus jiangxiensis]
MPVTDETSAAPTARRAQHRRAAPALLWALAVVTAAALAVDAYVHADLAPAYDSIRASVSQGTLFRVEAAAAALAALLVLVARRRRAAWLFAFLVAAGGLAAVLLYRYVQVGAVGPLPDMYEPIWFPEKTASAVAEAVGAGTALLGLVLAWRMNRTAAKAP